MNPTVPTWGRRRGRTGCGTVSAVASGHMQVKDPLWEPVPTSRAPLMKASIFGCHPEAPTDRLVLLERVFGVLVVTDRTYCHHSSRRIRRGFMWLRHASNEQSSRADESAATTSRLLLLLPDSSQAAEGFRARASGAMRATKRGGPFGRAPQQAAGGSSRTATLI